MLNKSEILKKVIQEYNVKTTRDVQGIKAELDEYLRYDRYDIQNKNITNSRNGHRSKKIRFGFGEVDHKIA